MGASQLSVRSGSVVRAAFYIGCGLCSLASPALAQAPAPTPEFQSDPIQPQQSDKPDKPGKEGGGQEAPWNVEERVLLPLLLEEKRWLANYGPKHPKVLSVRERIEIVRDHLAKHPPAPPASKLAPQPPIPSQTSYREVPSSPEQAPPLPLPPIRSQILKSGETEDDAAAKDQSAKPQTATSRSQAELIRPAGLSTSGDRIPDPDAAETNDKDTPPVAIASSKPSTQGVVSPPRSVGDNPVSQPSPEQPRGNSFFETGFGQIIGIVGAVFLGVMIHLISLVVILRRYSAHLARLFHTEGVNPVAGGFVGEGSTAGAQSVAAAPATREMTQISMAETFDIGPTYEEETRQKQQALNQQEEAVLQHIFELNMQMREQISQLGSGAA